MAVVNFAMYLLFSSHSKKLFLFISEFRNDVIAVDLFKTSGCINVFKFTLKTEIILPETESI